MIPKRLSFPSRNDQGLPLVELFEPGGGRLVKTASEIVPEVEEYISMLEPEQGKTYTLMTALGSGELWSSNINGDYFPWDALVHEPPGWDEVARGTLEQKRDVAHKYCAQGGYGYTTFYGAHPFAHHVNYDFFSKKNRHPKPLVLGDVVFVALNPRMQRVELVTVTDHELARKHGGEDFITRIDNGEYPDVSMGCKVPFDVCSICGNVAKTRLDYCEHAKTMMNRILPDGRKVYVINTRPRFFDISYVLLGADRTGRVLGKVASVHRAYFFMDGLSADAAAMNNDHIFFPQVESMEKAASVKVAGRIPGLNRTLQSMGALFGEGRRELKEAETLGREKKVKQLKRIYTLSGQLQKSSSLRKRAIIDKPAPDSPEMRANQSALTSLNDNEPDVGRETLNALGMSRGAGLATPSMMGIVLKPREFQRMSLVRRGMGSIADAMDAKNAVFRRSEAVNPMDIDPGSYSPILRDLLMPLLGGRSAMGPPLGRRIKMIRITICAAPEQQEMGGDLLDKISADYNGYRQALVKVAARWPETLHDDPVLYQALWDDDYLDLFGEGPGMAKAASIFTPEQFAYLTGSYGWSPPAGEAEAASKMALTGTTL